MPTELTLDQVVMIVQGLRREVEHLQGLYGAFFGPDARKLRTAVERMGRLTEDWGDIGDAVWEVGNLRRALRRVRSRVTTLEQRLANPPLRIVKKGA